MEKKTSSRKKLTAAKSIPLPAAQKQTPEAKQKVVKKLLEKSVQQYYVKKLLSKGQKMINIGSLTTLNWLNKTGIQRLIKMGAVRAVFSPPLSELAGWQTRANRLKPVGVVTIDDFLAVDASDLAKILRTKKETAIKWQDLLRSWGDSDKPLRR